MGSLLIYGSYGYVGSLVAEDAIDRGLDPILAGRDRDRLREQVADLEQPGRRFSLENPSVVAEALEDVDCGVAGSSGGCGISPGRCSRM
ncbi:hypothetical protein [Natronococcus sp.]|uniref:hypothetical protein n=1 Tax=Natronococcus sp. TaxID=35747 RepID=UPI003A4D9456